MEFENGSSQPPSDPEAAAIGSLIWLSGIAIAVVRYALLPAVEELAEALGPFAAWLSSIV
jgi:hypothetical protein